MHRGTNESTTANLTTVLAHLLEEKGSIYKDKIDTKHDPTSHKYDQMYNIVYQLTKRRAAACVPGMKTPGKIKMVPDDELNHTDTHSSTQKMVQPKTLEHQFPTEVLASSLHEESEVVD